MKACCVGRLGSDRRPRLWGGSASIDSTYTLSSFDPVEPRCRRRGLRCGGRCQGVDGLTDIPPVPGLTSPCSSTGRSIPARTPRPRPDDSICGRPSSALFIARYRCSTGVVYGVERPYSENVTHWPRVASGRAAGDPMATGLTRHSGQRGRPGRDERGHSPPPANAEKQALGPNGRSAASWPFAPRAEGYGCGVQPQLQGTPKPLVPRFESEWVRHHPAAHRAAGARVQSTRRSRQVHSTGAWGPVLPSRVPRVDRTRGGTALGARAGRVSVSPLPPEPRVRAACPMEGADLGARHAHERDRYRDLRTRPHVRRVARCPKSVRRRRGRLLPRLHLPRARGAARDALGAG